HLPEIADVEYRPFFRVHPPPPRPPPRLPPPPPAPPKPPPPPPKPPPGKLNRLPLLVMVVVFSATCSPGLTPELISTNWSPCTPTCTRRVCRLPSAAMTSTVCRLPAVRTAATGTRTTSPSDCATTTLTVVVWPSRTPSGSVS